MAPPHSKAVLIFIEHSWPASVDGWPGSFNIAGMSPGSLLSHPPPPLQVDLVQGGVPMQAVSIWGVCMAFWQQFTGGVNGKWQ